MGSKVLQTIVVSQILKLFVVCAQRISCAQRLAVSLTASALFIAGCGLLPPTIHRPPPAALGDVRGIGLVRAEASREIGLAPDIEVVTTFVIEVGGASSGGALDKAVNLLRNRQWAILGENRPWLVSMTSTRWDAHLAATPFDSEAFKDHPDILLELQGEAVEKESLVIVKVGVY